LDKKILERFKNLEKNINCIENSKSVEKDSYPTSSFLWFWNKKYETYETILINQRLLLQFIIQFEDLLTQITNYESTHFKYFKQVTNNKYHLNYSDFQKLQTIFLTLKRDYHQGYLMSFKNLIQAEVFENQLQQSKELLNNGYIVASAVIAGVVLETGIREICTREEITHGKLDKMNADLAKKGIYNKLEQKRITALADIRNSAAHGKESEFTKEDVEKMIRDIEDFLAKYLDI